MKRMKEGAYSWHISFWRTTVYSVMECQTYLLLAGGDKVVESSRLKPLVQIGVKNEASKKIGLQIF